MMLKVMTAVSKQQIVSFSIGDAEGPTLVYGGLEGIEFQRPKGQFALRHL